MTRRTAESLLISRSAAGSEFCHQAIFLDPDCGRLVWRGHLFDWTRVPRSNADDECASSIV